MLQIFFSHMCMMLATKRTPLALITDPDAPTQAAKTIAFHLFITFIQDCKDLVINYIQGDIKQALQTNQDAPVYEHAKRRQRASKSWEKTLFALAWNTDDQPRGATYADLMTVLSDRHDEPLKQLVHARDSWSYEKLAGLLLQMGKSPNPTISAPVVSNGCFINALPVALKYIRSHFTGQDNADYWIIRLFSVVMKTMHIHFIPWKLEGQRTRAVQPTIWMILKKAPSETNQGPQDTPMTVEEATQEQAQVMADKDPSAPWSIPENLYQMRDFWKKINLPDDCDVQNASLGKLRNVPKATYVCKTYDYVHEKYTGENWIHHMALVWAILFSRVAPHLFFPKDTNIPQVTDSSVVTNAIRNMPWVSGTSASHKGTTAPKPLVTMFMTAIIGFLDERSPFAQYLNSHHNHQGKPWTDKHGRFSMFQWRTMYLTFLNAWYRDKRDSCNQLYSYGFSQSHHIRSHGEQQIQSELDIFTEEGIEPALSEDNGIFE